MVRREGAGLARCLEARRLQLQRLHAEELLVWKCGSRWRGAGEAQTGAWPWRSGGSAGTGLGLGFF